MRLRRAGLVGPRPAQRAALPAAAARAVRGGGHAAVSRGACAARVGGIDGVDGVAARAACPTSPGSLRQRAGLQGEQLRLLLIQPGRSAHRGAVPRRGPGGARRAGRALLSATAAEEAAAVGRRRHGQQRQQDAHHDPGHLGRQGGAGGAAPQAAAPQHAVQAGHPARGGATQGQPQGALHAGRA